MIQVSIAGVVFAGCIILLLSTSVAYFWITCKQQVKDIARLYEYVDTLTDTEVIHLRVINDLQKKLKKKNKNQNQ